MLLDRPNGAVGEINVTPLIDVLLVLLIIAMILLQLRAIFPVNVPPPVKGVMRPEPRIVLDLPSGGGYAVNHLRVSEARLGPRLRALYAKRMGKILFVHSSGERPYRDLIHAMDVAHAAGVEVIGYMP